MKYFEDFQVGETVVTRARTVTETDIVSFAALTGDWYPLHTDVEYAKKGPFGERIAHGLLVLSIANGLLLSMTWRSLRSMAWTRCDSPRRPRSVIPYTWNSRLSAG